MIIPKIVFVAVFVTLCHGLERGDETILSAAELKTMYGARMKNCTSPGYTCGDCNTSLKCEQLSGGEFFQTETTCSGSQTCLESTGQCTSVDNYQCDANVVNFTFVCHQPGMFPHPFSCTEHFMCVKKDGILVQEPIALNCNNGYGYNALTTMCTKQLDNCTWAVTPCKGYRSDLIGDSLGLYYVCMRHETGVYFPHVFACPYDYVYNGTACAEPVVPNGVVDGRCRSYGNFDDPNDCKGYLFCQNSTSAAVPRKCLTGLVFDYKLRQCVDFTCWRYL